MLLLVLVSARSVSFQYDCRMSEHVYTSNVRIERIRGPLRSADIPAESEPVMFGVHAGVAEHYGVAPGTEAERATTLDYIVAAAGG
jgi:hypothetical protein